LKLPYFAEQEIASISQQLNPVALSIRDLLFQQQRYDKKSVKVEGSARTVMSIDQIDEATVASWFIEIIPTTVKTTASATYFYLGSDLGSEILVKYPADLDVSANDNVVITGLFHAHAVTVETKRFLRTERKEVLNELGEPSITALIVENKTKQKVEYIRRT
jgi:hypothetical protein